MCKPSMQGSLFFTHACASVAKTSSGSCPLWRAPPKVAGVDLAEPSASIDCIATVLHYLKRRSKGMLTVIYLCEPMYVCMSVYINYIYIHVYMFTCHQ